MRTYPLPIHVQRFFAERLASQLHASPNTIASYRDTFRLLLRYAADRLRRQPTQLQVVDLDASLVGDFLTFLETNRGNGARSRNTRLSAIHSFFKYVASNEPQLLHHCQQVLAMPTKRHEKRTIDFLTRAEIEALIEATDKTTPYGRRDRMLLMLDVQTGLRVSELISLNCGDVALGTGAHVRCMGKGRKERSTPLRKDCVEALRRWLSERRGDDRLLAPAPHEPGRLALKSRHNPEVGIMDGLVQRCGVVLFSAREKLARWQSDSIGNRAVERL
jgi:integrase/recombinase XerD